MHGRIIAASWEDENTEIGVENFYNLCPSKFDYVSNMDKEDSERSIKECFDRPGLKYNAKERTLTIENKERYFTEKFKTFKTIVGKMSDVTLEDFSNGSRTEIYQLMWEYDDEYGTYLYINEEDLTTLDSFVRIYEDGDEIHIGNALDYHI